MRRRHYAQSGSECRVNSALSLTSFKDGAIGGVLSSITTTLFNIFFTTKKMMVRLIREMWNNLVQAFKVMVFNPEGLAPGQPAKR